jgi:hypothetical protein
LLVHKAGVKNTAPLVHIKLSAHSFAVGKKLQKRFVSRFVIVFCIVVLSIAPFFSAAIL